MLWIKYFPRCTQCKLLQYHPQAFWASHHTGSRYHPQQSVVKPRNKEQSGAHLFRKWFWPTTLTGCKRHISMCSVALGSSQSSVFGSAALTLFSCAQFVGCKKTISVPKRSGCFLFKWEILYEMPWLCSCLVLGQWSLQIFFFSSFTQELQGKSTLMLCFGSHQKQCALHIVAGGKEKTSPVLHIFSIQTSFFFFYHHFACFAHFILNSPAQLHKQQYWAPKLLAVKKIKPIADPLWESIVTKRKPT